jgi:hypothetical protein
MLHTLPVSSAGWTRDNALTAAARQANKLFGSIALLGDKHLVSVTPTFLTDPGPGPHAVTLVYVLNVPEAIAQALDERLADFPPQEVTPVPPAPQKPGDAWLYSLGKWLSISDPCTYPENWTVDLYRQALEAQGYRFERDFFDLDDVDCQQASEVTVGFAVYVADDPEETGDRPPYPYRVEACLFLSDWEPPIYVADYPSLLDLLAAFAPIVQTRLHIAHLVAREQEEEHAD